MTNPNRRHHWNGASYETILPTAETGGAMSITYVETPALSGPPSHVHAAEDEIFIILAGRIDVAIGDRRQSVGPLQAAFVPRGVAHSFRAGPDGARGLMVLTPGGFERFFAEIAAAGLTMPRDRAALQEMAARYGSTFVGPGLAPAEAHHA